MVDNVFEFEKGTNTSYITQYLRVAIGHVDSSFLNGLLEFGALIVLVKQDVKHFNKEFRFQTDFLMLPHQEYSSMPSKCMFINKCPGIIKAQVYKVYHIRDKWMVLMKGVLCFVVVLKLGYLLCNNAKLQDNGLVIKDWFVGMTIMLI